MKFLGRSFKGQESWTVQFGPKPRIDFDRVRSVEYLHDHEIHFQAIFYQEKSGLFRDDPPSVRFSYMYIVVRELYFWRN